MRAPRRTSALKAKLRQCSEDWLASRLIAPSGGGKKKAKEAHAAPQERRRRRARRRRSTKGKGKKTPGGLTTERAKQHNPTTPPPPARPRARAQNRRQPSHSCVRGCAGTREKNVRARALFFFFFCRREGAAPASSALPSAAAEERGGGGERAAATTRSITTPDARAFYLNFMLIDDAHLPGALPCLCLCFCCGSAWGGRGDVSIGLAKALCFLKRASLAAGTQQ